MGAVHPPRNRRDVQDGDDGEEGRAGVDARWEGEAAAQAGSGGACGGGSGITTLNTLTGDSQTFATSTSGTNFNISSSGSVHTFNIPYSSSVNTGLLTFGNWTTFNNKQATITDGTNLTFTGATLNIDDPFSITKGTITNASTTLLTVATNAWFNLLNASATSTFSSAILQTGMTDCDTAATSKVLYDLGSGKFSCGTDQGGGSGNATNSHNAGQVFVSKTMTNIGTSYVDIYAAAFDNENLLNIDFTGATSVRIVFMWDYVGAGTQQVRWVDSADNNNVLIESATFVADQDSGDSGWVSLPAAFSSATKIIEWQGKSTTSTDDPQAKGYIIYLK